MKYAVILTVLALFCIGCNETSKCQHDCNSKTVNYYPLNEPSSGKDSAYVYAINAGVDSTDIVVIRLQADPVGFKYVWEEVPTVGVSTSGNVYFRYHRLCYDSTLQLPWSAMVIVSN